MLENKFHRWKFFYWQNDRQLKILILEIFSLWKLRLNLQLYREDHKKVFRFFFMRINISFIEIFLVIIYGIRSVRLSAHVVNLKWEGSTDVLTLIILFCSQERADFCIRLLHFVFTRKDASDHFNVYLPKFVFIDSNLLAWSFKVFFLKLPFLPRPRNSDEFIKSHIFWSFRLFFVAQILQMFVSFEHKSTWCFRWKSIRKRFIAREN